MGLSVIGSGVIILVIMIFVMYTIPGIIDSFNSLGDVSSEASNLENSILQTDISIDTLSATSGESWVTFNLNNDGSEKLWNFDEFEVFITYDADIGGTKTVVTEQFTYLPLSSDFKIQRGELIMLSTETSSTITEGVDFDDCTGDCFVKLVNSRLTGTGRTTVGANINQDAYTTYISDDSGLTTPGGDVTFTRHVTDGINNRLQWEIWEYVGNSGESNEIVVLDTGICTFAAAGLTCDGAGPGPATDDADVVVFVTGVGSPNGGRNENAAMLITSDWIQVLGVDVPRFTRESTGGSPAVDVSYAIVEFTGSNWGVERVERPGSATTTTTTLLTTDVGDISRSFFHAQQSNVDNVGTDGLCEAKEKIELTATDTLTFTHSQCTGGWDADMNEVIWVIRNSQTAPGFKILVQHIDPPNRVSADIRESDWTDSEEDDWGIGITTLTYDLDESAITGLTGQSAGTGTAYPRGSISVILKNSTAAYFYHSDHTNTQDYAFQVTELPRHIGVTNWSIRNILNDFTDPGLINTDETAQITALLTYPIFSGGNVAVVVSTDKGVTSSNAIIVT